MITVHAPLDGWLMPLAEVPDPVFAQGLVGAGLAIDPVDGLLVSPCDGVIREGSHRHALTLQTAAGDLLIHVGIDSVALGGAGFTWLVAPGLAVTTGTPLMRIDLDQVAGGVPSLVTPIVMTGTAIGDVTVLHPMGRVRRGAALFQCGIASAEPVSCLPTVRWTREVICEHGLHARPSAALAAVLQSFSVDVRVCRDGREANARSVTALMGLATKQGDVVDILVQGEASDALDTALRPWLAPIGDKPTPVAESLPAQLRAQIAVRGAVVGVACTLTIKMPEIPEYAGSPAAEDQRLVATLLDVASALRTAAMAEQGSRKDLLEAHAALCGDPALESAARGVIRTGKSAAFGWSVACQGVAAQLRAAGDPRIAERSADLADVERRVIQKLLGHAAQGADVPAGAVILADELLPSDLLTLDRDRVKAVVTARGGVTSHVAILAATMDLPMLVGAGNALLSIPPGTELIIDAEMGIVEIAPGIDRLTAFQTVITARAEHLAAARRRAREPAVLADGSAVTVKCNLGSSGEAAAAYVGGAEGVGLLRSEFLFLDRESAPTAAEQRAEYESVTGAFDGREVTIRTLDAGGDKPLKYVAQASEDNPALGVRGVRVGFSHPMLLREQLAALGMTAGHVRILVPMVNDVSELRAVRALMAGAAHPHSLGIMIETPASALLADALAAEADFFSIGSNDLTQYVLAIDRLNTELGHAFDGLHPAVLSAMRQTVAAARAHGKPVSICGGLAGDPEAIPILIGLGLRDLSVAPAQVAQVKAAVRGLDPILCAQLADAAVRLVDAPAVRTLVRSFLNPNNR